MKNKTLRPHRKTDEFPGTPPLSPGVERCPLLGSLCLEPCAGGWTARRSNQSILKEISPEYSLETLILKLQYFGHLMQRTDSLEKTMMLGKIEGRRMRWLSESRESVCKAGDLGPRPGLGRSAGEGNGNPLQFLPGESQGQRGLVGYAPWGCRVRHDGATVTPQLSSLSPPAFNLSQHQGLFQ